MRLFFEMWGQGSSWSSLRSAHVIFTSVSCFKNLQRVDDDGLRLCQSPEHLALYSYTDVGDGLEFHHFDHCSLDILEECSYLTNTEVKFILVTTDLYVKDTKLINKPRFLRLYLRTCTVLKHRVWLLRLTARPSRKQHKFC
ncbi:uncharacterized protein LOC106445258 isoform X3 [Brassica napus]|uniref:uncharacterized protein LOC106445258 isoform X3 n=1 Tax=Brassica napus TaxID=3708 RepID=UPI000BBEA9A8|nr:uncharacterized protein LOC106445258 isoform X3 [Brassica napus]